MSSPDVDALPEERKLSAEERQRIIAADRRAVAEDRRAAGAGRTAAEKDAPADGPPVGLAEGRTALAASIFHYNEYGIPATKAYLAERGVPVRLTAAATPAAN